MKANAKATRKQETAIAPVLLENPKQGLKDRRDMVCGWSREQMWVVKCLSLDVPGAVGSGACPETDTEPTPPSTGRHSLHFLICTRHV